MLEDQFSAKIDRGKVRLLLKASQRFEQAYLLQPATGAMLPLHPRKKSDTIRYEIELKKISQGERYRMVGLTKNGTFESPSFWVTKNEELKFGQAKVDCQEVLALIDRIAERNARLYNFEVAQVLRAQSNMEKALIERRKSF
jgi:hypothetical protein